VLFEDIILYIALSHKAWISGLAEAIGKAR
jgi:hypothetical protein